MFLDHTADQAALLSTVSSILSEARSRVVLDGRKASFDLELDSELESSGVLKVASYPEFGLSTAALVTHEVCRSASICGGRSVGGRPPVGLSRCATAAGGRDGRCSADGAPPAGRVSRARVVRRGRVVVPGFARGRRGGGCVFRLTSQTVLIVRTADSVRGTRFSLLRFEAWEQPKLHRGFGRSRYHGPRLCEPIYNFLRSGASGGCAKAPWRSRPAIQQSRDKQQPCFTPACLSPALFRSCTIVPRSTWCSRKPAERG
jgi:hypothetical protein